MSGNKANEANPPAPLPNDALTLLRTLRGHEDVILRCVWSPDGRTLATTSVDRTIRLWDFNSEDVRVLSGHTQGVNEVAWGAEAGWLASCSFDRTIRVWDLSSGKQIGELVGHTDDVSSISVSPDCKLLASGSADRSIRMWRTEDWQLASLLAGHSDAVYRVAWSPKGDSLASCSKDGSLMFWDALLPPRLNHVSQIGRGGSRPSSIAWSPSGRLLSATIFNGAVVVIGMQGQSPVTLSEHSRTARSSTFTADERLLATSSNDGSVLLWRTDTWEPVARIHESTTDYWPQGIAFHPSQPVLATFGERDRVVRLWQVDVDRLLGVSSATPSRVYRNAKVVLLGDTGVGKTGLRLVLTGEKFEASDSTYGRRVWTLSSEEHALEGRIETREALLWDMAGQPEYRLIHQLHLKGIVVALFVFDSRQAVGDPLASVRHWERAVRQAQDRQGAGAVPLRRFLVIARSDVAGTPLSRERIEAVVREWRLDGYFETSAKEGWMIRELRDAIRDAIPWAELPEVHSSELLTRIREFLVAEKAAGRLLATADELWRSFEATHVKLASEGSARDSFDASLSRLENRDVLRCLSFGGYSLLQPELLDGYASAIIRSAAADTASASGSIAEEEALGGLFQMPASERVVDANTERLLLLATVEELLQHQLALREPSQDGVYLVFPSQSLRESRELDEPKGMTVSLMFDGPVRNLYATLVVRLAHSGEFTVRREGIYKNAALFGAGAGGECGLSLREFGDGQGEARLFFRIDGAGRSATPETQYRFEAFVLSHLQRRALSGSIKITRNDLCPRCGTAVPGAWVESLRAQGRTSMDCPADGTRIALAEPLEQVEARRGDLDRMESKADRARDIAVSGLVLRGKEEVDEHDVFICYSHADEKAVAEIASQLRRRRLRPWIDTRDLRPGDVWLDVIDRLTGRIHAAAVCIGPNGTGRVQNLEIAVLLQMFAERGTRVIPVLLPGVEEQPPEFSRFLKNFNWVDFRKPEPHPLDQLVFGVTGVHPDAQ